MTAVEDHRGVVHAVVLQPTARLTGATACNARFVTAAHVVLIKRTMPFVRSNILRMTETNTDVNCMACIAELATYHTAWAEE